MKLTEFLENIGRPIAYYPSLKCITGSTVATIFLCQFVYWTGKQKDGEGWIYKTQGDIEAETGLTRTEQETARKILTKKGFLEHKYSEIPRQLYYRLKIDAVNESWETVHTIMRKSCIQGCGNPTYNNAEIPQAIIMNTEITTEITQRIKDIAQNQNASNKKIAVLNENEWQVHTDLWDAWYEAFPLINVQSEADKAIAWVLSNPTRKKKDWARFLNNWFTKAHDKAERAKAYKDAIK